MNENEHIKMYVAGARINGTFVTIIKIIKIGQVYKVKGELELQKDNYGHLTLKNSKFFRERKSTKEGETHDISNLILELRDAGLEIVEIHSGTTYRDVETAIIPSSTSDFPAPL